MTAVPTEIPPRQKPSRRPVQAPGLFAIALAAVTALTVLISFWMERFEPWVPLITAVLFITFIGEVGWWPKRRALVLTIAVDILLIFAYLWSLDDRVHVTIQASPSGFTATVGGEVATVNTSRTNGRVGLMSGGIADYRVLPTGEAPVPSDLSFLGRFGEWMRLATPKPAWANLRLTPDRSRPLPESIYRMSVLSGSWANNPRGELEGDVSSTTLLGGTARGQYVFSGDLMRGDGTQGMLVGVDSEGQGYVLTIRMDQPDALWFGWANGARTDAVGGTGLHVQTVSMLQRDVRLLLANAMVGLILVLLAVPLYLLLTGLLWLAGGKRSDEVETLERTVDDPVVVRSLVAVTALTGVVVVALIASSLLQRIPHVQDSVAYLFQAKMLAMGRLSVPIPHPETFFNEEFLPMYNGQWFSKYPPGWPLLLMVGVILHIPWLVNPILTGINLVLIYLIGREVYDGRIPLLAMILALSSPFFLFLAGDMMAHSAELTYLGGFALLAIRWVRRTESGRVDGAMDWHLLLPAGFLLGMGFITRQLDALAFAVPFALLLLSRPVMRRILSLRWLVLGALPPVLFLLFYNWKLAGNPLHSTYTLWWSFDHLGFTPDFTPGQGLWNMSFNVEMLLAHLFGWPFYFTLALASLPFLLGRANRWDTIFGLSAVCVMGAYVFYFAHGVMYGPRYYYIAIPWFALLTARGLQELYRLPLRLPLPLRVDRMAALLVPGLLLLTLVMYNLRVYLPAQIPIYRGYNYSNASSLNAVQAAHLHHALVFVVENPPGQWWSYGEVFSGNSPLLNGDVVYARDQGPKNRQAAAHFPGRQYWLLNNTQLTRLHF